MKRDFDLLAPHYRWMEWLSAGGKLHRCRTEYIKDAMAAKHIMVFGEGNGRFVREILRTNPTARVTCLDASSRMIDCARRRLRRSGLAEERVSFVQGNVLEWTAPAGAYDLIVTQFFLDCFPPCQLRRIIDEIARSASEQAKWLVADFRKPAAGWRRVRAQVILKMMYLFFRIITRLPARNLTDPDSLLRAHRFRLSARKISEWGLLHSDLWRRERPRSLSACFKPPANS